LQLTVKVDQKAVQKMCEKLQHHTSENMEDQQKPQSGAKCLTWLHGFRLPIKENYKIGA